MAGEWEDAPEQKSGGVWEEAAPKRTNEQINTEYNPEGGAMLGAGAGLAAKTSGKIYNKFLSSAPTAVQVVNPVPAGSVTVAGAPDLQGSEKWVHKLTGQHVPGSQMEKEALAKAQEMAKAIGRGGELAGGSNVGGVLLGPEPIAKTAAAERAAIQAAAAQKATLLAKAKALGIPLNKLGEFLSTGGVGTAMKVVNPMLALAGAGAGYNDMQRRWEHGDKARAVISGLGALGSAATMAPNPLVKGLGAAVGVGAPITNAAIDKFYGREGYAHGGLVYLANGGLALRIK